MLSIFFSVSAAESRSRSMAFDCAFESESACTSSSSSRMLPSDAESSCGAAPRLRVRRGSLPSSWLLEGARERVQREEKERRE